MVSKGSLAAVAFSKTHVGEVLAFKRVFLACPPKDRRSPQGLATFASNLRRLRDRVQHLILVAGLVHNRLRVIAAEPILAGCRPHQRLAMHLRNQARHLQTGCLDTANMCLHVSVKWIEASLASCTPEQRVQWKPRCCRNTIRSTGSTGRQIAEQSDIGIENERQLIVVPHWIELSEIGHIEGALLQAGIVEDGFQPEDDWIDVPMHLIEGRGRGAVLAEARTSRRIKPGVQLNAAETGHAKRPTHDIHATNRFPEADLEPHPQLRRAHANWGAARVGCVFLPHGYQVKATEPDGEHATPADIRDRVRKPAGTGRRCIRWQRCPSSGNGEHEDEREFTEGLHRPLTSSRLESRRLAPDEYPGGKPVSRPAHSKPGASAQA